LKGTTLALILVGVAAVGVVAFFMLGRRQQQIDPLTAGVNGAVGFLDNIVNKTFGLVGGVVDVPVRVVNDVVDVVEAPFKAGKKLLSSIF
jgi:hypothetical protein